MQNAFKITYGGRKVLQSLNPAHAKIQKQRLQRPVLMPDGLKYYPLLFHTPHVEVLTKTTRFEEMRVHKTYVAILRTPVVESEDDPFYNITREEMKKKIDDILDEAGIPHRLNVFFIVKVMQVIKNSLWINIYYC